MKQRFSSLDIKVIAHELSKSLHSLRVVNIYDLSSRIFLIKFAKPDHREQLVIDSGFRCHLTAFARTTAAAPSPFVARLRKFLKTRRVTSVSQVGTDRIIEITFSDGQYRFFLEFYAGGNIVLCDNELKVIALLRNVDEGAEYERLRMGVQYNLSERQNIDGIPPLNVDRVKEGLRKFLERQKDGAQAYSKKSRQKPQDALRKALAGSISEYPPMLLEHALSVAGFDVSLPPEQVLNDEGLLGRLVSSLSEAANITDGLLKSEHIAGYIIGKRKDTPSILEVQPQDDEDDARSVKKVLYNDFHPFKPRQFQNDPEVSILEFQGFNRTVDEFFSSIEGQKLESRLQEKEDTARRKIQQAQQDQARRLGGLQRVQELNVRKAQAIEANVERVAEATDAINGLIAQGMDWIEIDRLIELEQKRLNPVAEIIKLPLKLNENTATLLLGELEIEDGEEVDGNETGSEPSDSDDERQIMKEETTKFTESVQKMENKILAIDIDLALSPWSNARQYYDQKKTAAAKEEKTVLASSKALESARQKIELNLKKSLKQEKQVLRPLRKPFWFEKFFYFISSDGYLVLGGRDAPQNEVLYSRHLKRGDVYVHADLQGAVPVIIKNNPATPDAPIPPSTLSQAGNLSVATSSAWDSKAVMSAWWVNADQITKTHGTGEYLGIGGFAVREEKNFLPPAQLLLGFAVLFHITDDSKQNHEKYRVADGQMPRAVSKPMPAHTSQDDASHLKDNEDATTAINGYSNAEEDEDTNEDYDSGSDKSENRNEDSKAPSNPLQAGVKEALDVSISHGYDLQETSRTVQNAHTTLDEKSLSGSGDRFSLGDAPEAQTGDIYEETDEEPLLENSSVITRTESTAPSSARRKGPVPVRGKRGKNKKIATKYADQDEEDREEAMRLLGSKAGQDRAEQLAKERQAREQEEEANNQHRREQHLRNQKAAKERESLRLMQERGESADVDEEDSEASRQTDLEALVGTPLPSDEILEAIPVCAPWAALGKYKYKAKLQPGSQKKGKAVREILAKWNSDGANRKNVDDKAEDMEKIWPKEIDLIKGWKDTEVFNVLPVGKVRVMMSGASAGKNGKGGGAKGHPKGGKGSKKSR